MTQDKKKCSQCGKTLSFLSKFINFSYENINNICLKCALKIHKDRRTENDSKDIIKKQAIPDSSANQIKQKIEKAEIEKAEIEKALIDSGLFKADASNWISEIILSNIEGSSSKVIDLAIRKHGVLLSAEEKRKHGIRGNAKVSKEYLLSLTDEGKKDPIRAAFIVVQQISHKWHLRRVGAKVSKTEKLGLEMEAELCCPHDDRTCKAALELDGTRFPMDEAPGLPLPVVFNILCQPHFYN